MKSLFLIFGLLLSLKVFGITWSIPEKISDVNSQEGHITIDNSGNCFAIWKHFDGVNDIIQSSVNNGIWTEPKDLSRKGFNAKSSYISANNRRALALWILSDGALETTFYANDTWNEPCFLSQANVQEAHASINAKGDALIIWVEALASSSVIKVASFLAEKNQWDEPKILSNPEMKAESCHVAFSDCGVAIATWISIEPLNKNIVRASNIAGEWIVIETRAEKENAAHPKVCINTQGIGLLAWQKIDDPFNFDEIKVSHFDGTYWSDPIHVSNPSLHAAKPDLSINDAGSAIVCWRNESNLPSMGTNVFREGIWQGHHIISKEEAISSMHVGIDGNSQAHTIWIAKEEKNFKVRHAEYLSEWSEPKNISLDGEDASLASLTVGKNGKAFALWNSEGVIKAIMALP